MDDEMKADRASKGGEARMKKLSREERSTLAREAAKARWQRVKSKDIEKDAGIEVPREESLPEAKYPGILNLAGVEIPVYVRSEEHTSELQSRQYLVCR